MMAGLMLLAALALQPAPGPSLAEVVPGPNRHFHRGEEMRGCPALTAKCRRAGYVIPGDRLVVWERRGSLAHVEFVSVRASAGRGWSAGRGSSGPWVAYQSSWWIR